MSSRHHRADAFAALGAAVDARAGLGPDDLYTGAVVLVASASRIFYQQAFGAAQTHTGSTPLDRPRPTTTDTIFDLASVTKVAATTAALMVLRSEGRLDLDSRLGSYLPAFDHGEKRAITVRQLLTHRSGLHEWQPIYLHARTPAQVLELLADLDLRYPVGRQRHYSDLGFMLLGALVEQIAGRPLDAFLRQRVYAPLGMTSTTYRPGADLRHRVAATSCGNPDEYRMIATGDPYPIVGASRAEDFGGWRRHTLVGEANDANAWHAWQGVAGSAGLFSTASDLAAYGQMLINGGRHAGAELVSAAVVAEFLAPQQVDGQAVGFWSDRFAVVGATGGFGHSGFTGTELLLDPDRELVVVLLTNRLHPHGARGSIAPVWRDVLRHALACDVMG
jgi:CubicO group peptidase (beta-lactamase class C family)